MRVFFAIEFEAEIKNQIFNSQQELKKFCNSGNFTTRENFHLTLRFIGEQEYKQVEVLKTVLKNTAKPIKQFELYFDNPGYFVKGNKKIIWLGVKKSKELNDLYSSLEFRLREAGFERENRDYCPHITLAREVRLETFEQAVKNISIADCKIRVNSISLMESTRIDNKLRYIAVEKQELQA